MEFALCNLTDEKLARLSPTGRFLAELVRSRLFAEFWRQPEARGERDHARRRSFSVASR